MCATLTEDDVSRYYELGVGFLGAEALAGTLLCFVGTASGGVCGGTMEDEGEERRMRDQCEVFEEEGRREAM